MTGCSRVLLAVLLALAAASAGPVARADVDETKAEKYYQSAMILFNADSWAQALVEFRLAYESAPHHRYLFNMAQCEYLLGKLKDALAHYQQFLDAVANSGPSRRSVKKEFIDLARLRIDAINQRPSVFSINSDPEPVEIVIEGKTRTTGQAPNQFEVPHGRYRITASRQNYVTETRDIDIAVAETKPVWFKLAPIPARLEIHTAPRNATLYVRGSRAQNPYIQLVDPGTYEIYAEATDFNPRREIVVLGPGAQRVIDFRLPYHQRSGRPELIGFWTAAGSVAAASFLLAQLDENRIVNEKFVVPATLVLAGGLAGGIGGALVATAYVPSYIPDNLALFRIGAMWIGAADGAAIGFAMAPRLDVGSGLYGWFGGALGLGAGALTGVLLDDRAPNYGRVALIQSGAAVGMLMGTLAVPALKPADYAGSDYFKRNGPLGVLVGLNLGLGAGLALAYLPDQRLYGPSWQRVILVDLAVGAGAFAGALATTVENCSKDPETGCTFASDRVTARSALVGSVLGLAAGWWLTRSVDRDINSPADRALGVALLPIPAALTVLDSVGSLTLVPGLAAQGRF